MIEKLKRIRDLSNEDPQVEIWTSINDEDDYNVLLITHFDDSKSIKRYEIVFVVDKKKGDIKTEDGLIAYPYWVAKVFNSTIDNVQKILMSRSPAAKRE